MARPAILAGAMAIPLDQITDLAGMKKTLTALHEPMGEAPVEVLLYSLDDDYLYAPRQFGLDYCKRHGIEWEDHTVLGREVKFKKIPKPRDYQVGFIDELVEATEHYYDFIAKAHTGFGKTVSFLVAAARIGLSTLVIVDQDNLKDRWLDELRDLFGMTVENGDVGIIQGKICQWDRPIVIAMVHTLSQKTFPDEVYNAFGLVGIDEVHTVGAPCFSVVLRQFPAAFRFGVSATPKRKDGLQKALDYNLGRIRVAAEKEHEEAPVYFVNHPTVYSWYANISPKIGRILTEVAEDGSRNLLAAEMILLLWETGRDVIGMSDRIEQLQHIESLLYYMGVDGEEMGVYAGETSFWRYAKNPTPARRPAYLVRHEETGEAEYTPVSLQLISKKVPAAKLAQVKAEARIFLGTYGKCAKGFDEPRLVGGIDLTPRGTAEQIRGRTLRRKEGYKPPLWVTIVDENNYRFLFAFWNRIADYVKDNAVIYRWGDDGGLTECEPKRLRREVNARVKELKSMRIEPRKDGTHMLVTQSSEKVQKKQLAIDTVKAIRSRHQGSREGS